MLLILHPLGTLPDRALRFCRWYPFLGVRDFIHTFAFTVSWLILLIPSSPSNSLCLAFAVGFPHNILCEVCLIWAVINHFLPKQVLRTLQSFRFRAGGGCKSVHWHYSQTDWTGALLGHGVTCCQITLFLPQKSMINQLRQIDSQTPSDNRRPSLVAGRAFYTLCPSSSNFPLKQQTPIILSVQSYSPISQTISDPNIYSSLQWFPARDLSSSVSSAAAHWSHGLRLITSNHISTCGWGQITSYPRTSVFTFSSAASIMLSKLDHFYHQHMDLLSDFIAISTYRKTSAIL